MAFALPAADNAEPLVTYSKASARESTAPPHVSAVPSMPEIFNHKRHASLQLECAYCHKNAASGERAGFPVASACMACHREVAADKSEIRRLAAMPASLAIVPQSPVYRLPDFVFFSHRKHEARGIACAHCHGDVWTQDQIRPVLQMKMKACVACHQTSRAKVTCTVCHELSQ
jgi:formate-dependent nitrite reductase cytochrome c552 subunit